MTAKEIEGLINDVLERSNKGLSSLVRDAKKGFKKIAESPFKD